MKAKNIISPLINPKDHPGLPEVSPETSLPEVLSAISLSDTGMVRVTDQNETLGVIDTQSAMTALSAFFVPREECSFIDGRCAASDYSASRVARAVEDADAHLTGLWTTPADSGHIHFTLKVGRADPDPVVMSLQRYGFEVTDSYSTSTEGYKISDEAFDALRIYLNV